MIQLRPHQQDAITSVEDAIAAGERRIVMQAPIAFGKTLCAAKLIEAREARGERSIFVAPALSLIDQTVERFYEYGLRDIGVLQAQHPMTSPHRRIQVASAQTLMRRRTPPASLVIVDESHLRFSFISRWMAQPSWKDTPFIGLSATPWSIGMGKDWRKLIAASTMRKMAGAGWLKQLRYYAPIEIDASNVRIVAGEYVDADLSAVSRSRMILSNTVKEWMDRASDRPTIAFCVDRAHAQDMQARFIECGVPCGYIDGDTEAIERQKIGRQLEGGEIKVVTSVGCLIAGLDWTFVNCILFAVKTKSRIKWVQGIGRGMRLHPGQTDCLLLDCAGNAHLGHPYDVHQDWLDDGSKEAAEKRKEEKGDVKEARKCPRCTAAMEPSAQGCSECGFEFPKKQSDVVELDAAMQEVNPGGTRGKESASQAGVDRQVWYSSLKAIGEAHGYKPGWPAVQYKERFSQWPDLRALHDVALGHPAPEVSSWVRSRMIRWAKRRTK